MRDLIKSTLHKTGLFPVVRTAYRNLSPEVRSQRRKELGFYSALLRPGQLTFDVGANLGQRTEIFLELGQRSILVEPNPQCANTLKFLFGNNPNVELVMEAIGASVGQIDFYTHGTDATGSALPDWDKKVFGSDRGHVKNTVPMTTLDALIARYGVPAFTKIDVEGFEPEVLRGLSQPLPLLSFEYHANSVDRIRECLDLLGRFSACTIRASSMECDWVTQATNDYEQCIREIQQKNAKGDLFVWSAKSVR